MKKISVIVNCFNGEKYLDKCLQSIINQKYKNFEIIFFDNCSTDNSINIVKNFKDNRIKLFSSQTKLNLYQARNEAIKNASGELIAFLDVDDWWDKNYLNSREKDFDNNKYHIFYNNAFMFYEKNGKHKKYKNYILPNGRIYSHLARDYPIIISGLIIRRDVFDAVGKFNSKFNIIGDFDLIMKASRSFNFHAFDTPLIYYRVHQNNFSKKNTNIFFEEYLYWYQSQLNSENTDFRKNKMYFKNRLLFLEINHLLLNEKKNFFLLKKIFEYPNRIQMIKFIVGFMLPKKIIKLLKK